MVLATNSNNHFSIYKLYYLIDIFQMYLSRLKFELDFHISHFETVSITPVEIGKFSHPLSPSPLLTNSRQNFPSGDSKNSQYIRM